MKIKNLFALMCAALLSTGAMAQKESGRVSLGVEVALPMGDFADQSNFGIGGSLRYELPVADKLSLTGTAGVVSFGGKEITSGVAGFAETTIKTTSMMIPIQVGAKYYFQEMMKGFYGAVETGVHINSAKTTTDATVFGITTSSSATSSKSNFGVAPEIGYHLDSFDFGVRYQMLFVSESVTTQDPYTGMNVTTSSNKTFSYLGLRLAYVFGGK